MNRRAIAWTALSFVALILSCLLAIAIGTADITLGTTVQVFACKLGGPCDGATIRDEAIVWAIRAPRTLLAALVGAGLSICGAVIQSLVRNILADPYLLGIASGASTGAATVLLFGIGGAFGLAGGAFVGALIAMALVFALTVSNGEMTSERVVFAGITVGLGMSALTNLMVFIAGSDGAARSVMFWMLGSLVFADWSQLLLPTVGVLLTLIITFSWGPRLDAISVSDETARILGFHPHRLRLAGIILVSACVAILVSVAGAIGFVGLVVPHLARRLVGATNRSTIPAAAMLGALLLVWADLLGRVVLAPRELPLGVITALVGTPVLMILVRRLYRRT